MKVGKLFNNYNFLILLLTVVTKIYKPESFAQLFSQSNQDSVPLKGIEAKKV